MAKIRLYTQTLNPFSEKVAHALDLKKLEYERVVSNDPEDTKRWSPITHELPVLEVDGERIHDSLEILRWLEERFPEPPLFSRDPKTAEAQLRLAEWSDQSFAWYWNQWRSARFPRPGDEQPAAAGIAARLRSLVEKTIGRPTRTLSRVEVRELQVIEEVSHRLDDLVSFLGDRDYFRSDAPGVADLSIFGMLQILRDGPMPVQSLLAERATLIEYMRRMEKVLHAQ